MQHAWAYEQQLTLSCHYHSLRAHLKLMLRFDILLQSTNIKRETTLSVECEGSNGEREREREREKGKWRQNEKGEGERERQRQDEESLGWPLRCLCLLENKACHCAPCACLMQTEAEIEEGVVVVFCVGGVKWQNVLIEKKPCLLSSYSDTIKQLGEGCSQSLIILLQCVVPFGQWYHETAPHRASHNTTGCWTTVPWGVALKTSFVHWIILHFLWRLLRVTHPVVAVLTQVIASNEKGHQLPVVLKIHRLFPFKGWRKNQKERGGEIEQRWHVFLEH